MNKIMREIAYWTAGIILFLGWGLAMFIGMICDVITDWTDKMIDKAKEMRG